MSQQFASRLPQGITCAADYEALAQAQLEPAIAAWLMGGAGEEHTLRANRDAFARLRLVPRLLRDVSAGHTGLELLGQRLRHPLLLAPVASHGLLHAEGELATARAAAATDTPLVLSTQANRSLEEVAAVGPPLRWFQLYLQPRREDTLALLGRAQAAGYSALMLTLDAPVQAPNRRAQRLGFQLPPDLKPVNLQAQRPPPIELAAGDSLILRGYMREAPRAEDLRWLRAQTRLPLLAKGVCHPDDAAQLLELGFDGLVVSNHGGRALDGMPASLALLPAIRARVGASVPVLFDGGIRSGSDVFKALACGADAVLLGRLPLCGLAVAGALGTAHVLKLLREELELCMALTGCARLADIDARALFDPLPGASSC